MILAIKTASMQAQLLLLDDAGEQMRSDEWDAGRELSKDLLRHIDILIENDWDQITSIVVFRGPGSFTSLRIGVTTANTIAYAQDIPIVGVLGEDWLSNGVARVLKAENDIQVLPEYGADPHITSQKK